MTLSARRRWALGVAALAAAFLLWQWLPTPLPARWSATELAQLRGMTLAALPPVPRDASNAVADDPRAAELGGLLFSDTRFSANGRVSCATCHQRDKAFTDGLPRSVGLAPVERNAMSLLGAAWSPWFYWDGRKDSQWSQALEPLEHPREHGSNRVDVARALLTDPDYRQRYAALFGPVDDLAQRLADTHTFPSASPRGTPSEQAAWQALSPADQHAINEVFSRVGKLLAAWQRGLRPAGAPFDRYVAELDDDGALRASNALSRAQLAGLRLFLGKAQCVNCHNGPLFTNYAFHNTGVLSAPGLAPAAGRAAGLRLTQADPFNCLGQYSDAQPSQCQELRFARGGDELVAAQRTGSLRHLAATAPYMHAGQIATLDEVIEHYDRAEPALVGHNEAKPLGLRAVEKRQLLAFLQSLNPLDEGK